MRLDRFTAQQLGISRTIAGREIRGSRVTIGGEITRNAAFRLSPEHDVTYDGDLLARQHGPCYFMLNKPQGYIYSTDDPDHPTVLYFLGEPVARKLHAAERLDIGTTGLVLMTDDSQWSHRTTSPHHHCKKTYLVMLESPVIDGTAEQFAKGIQLYNEKDLTKPAVLKVTTLVQARLTISEGRYHQVRRMFAVVGSHVVELHRERTGGITLDVDLAPDEYRPLTEEEIASAV